jgi:hypothetical protein
MSVPEKRNKAARVVIIGLLIGIVAIPIGAMSVLAASHGEGNSMLAPNCLSLRSNQPTVVAGGSGVILFSCSGSAAITVGKSDQFRPSFTLPAGYTGLRIVSHALGATACDHCPILVSGQPVDLNGPGSFDYCAGYAEAPTTGLSSFKVAWSK